MGKKGNLSDLKRSINQIELDSGEGCVKKYQKKLDKKGGHNKNLRRKRRKQTFVKENGVPWRLHT